MELLEFQILKSADFEPHNAMSNLYSAAEAVIPHVNMQEL